MPRSSLRSLTALSALTTLGVSTVAGTADASGSRVVSRVRDRTLVVEGGRAADAITLRVPAATPFLVSVDIGDDGSADASFHRSRFDTIVVRGGDGDDIIRIDETAELTIPFTDVIPTVLRGQHGADTLIGGAGDEELRGGPADDIVDGNGGNDLTTLDDGDDVFIWDPGDGSDVVEGRAGHDVMTFNGAPGNETFTAVSANGRLRFTRSVGSIVMDVDGVEQVDVAALGGSDFVEIDDLSGSDVTALNVDVGGSLDDAIDSVFVDGSPRADTITIAGTAGVVDVGGLAAAVRVRDAEPFDRLLVSGFAGADHIDAAHLAERTMHLSVLAGDGADHVLGSPGGDNVLAGAGRDVVDGDRGDDDVSLDEGDDEFVWNPGDGSDVIDGDAGFDVVTFNGSDDAEVLETFSLGSRFGLARDIGFVFMDVGSVEQLDLNARGGPDQLILGDLQGVGVDVIDLNLAGTADTAAPDGETDAVTVAGTPGDDIVTVTGAAGAAEVVGLEQLVEIVHTEPLDSLAFAGNGGDDTVDATALGTDTIRFT